MRDSCLQVRAQWRGMAERWADNSRQSEGIPRGYFVLDQSAKIYRTDEKAPLQIHPFSIMEYSAGSVQLLDYVYTTAYTNELKYRGEVIQFFDQYRKDMGRQGKYLLGCDDAEPLWDALFNSPEELRRARPAQLRLIEARIYDAINGQDVSKL